MGGDLDDIGQFLHRVLLVTADTNKGAPSKLICQLLHQQQKHTVHLFATVKETRAQKFELESTYLKI